MSELAAATHHALDGEVPNRVVRQVINTMAAVMRDALLHGESVYFTGIGSVRPTLRTMCNDRTEGRNLFSIVLTFKETKLFKERAKKEIKDHEGEVRIRARSARPEDQEGGGEGVLPSLWGRHPRRSPSLPPLRQLAHGEHAEALTTARCREIYFHLEKVGEDTTKGIAEAVTGGDRGKVAYQIRKLYHRGVLVRYHSPSGMQVLYAIAGSEHDRRKRDG